MTSDLLIHPIITIEHGGSFAFCDFYPFTSASGKRFRSMMAYVVRTTGED